MGDYEANIKKAAESFAHSLIKPRRVEMPFFTIKAEKYDKQHAKSSYGEYLECCDECESTLKHLVDLVALGSGYWGQVAKPVPNAEVELAAYAMPIMKIIEQNAVKDIQKIQNLPPAYATESKSVKSFRRGRGRRGGKPR